MCILCVSQRDNGKINEQLSYGEEWRWWWSGCMNEFEQFGDIELGGGTVEFYDCFRKFVSNSFL